MTDVGNPSLSAPLLSPDIPIFKEVEIDKPEPDDLRFWSITTIIGVLDKPALLYWAAEQTAEAAVSIAATLAGRIQEDGRENVVKWLRDARFRQVRGQRTATDLGIAVHALLEEYALTGVLPEGDEETRPFLEQFDRWAQKWQPKYKAAELTVYSPTYGYAGTADGIMEIGGMTVNFDYKTSRKSFDNKGKPSTPYPEVGLQIAAARYAELAATWRPRKFEQYRRRYYALGAGEQEAAVPVPEVDGGIVIHITPDHCDAYPVRCDEDVYTAFLYVVEAARYQFEMSKTIIGAPLTHPEDV